MKFSIDKNIIQNLLIEHHKVVPIRTTLPVLSTAFFCVEKNKLTIRTTDLEQTITSETLIEDEQEGSACIPMGKLHEIVSAMPEDKISFSVNEDFLVELNNKQGAYKITGRSPEEFPEDSKLETAEKIKKDIGCAYPANEVNELVVRGRNLAEGIPRSFTLNSNEILEALQEPLSGIIDAVKNALEKTPPELGSDVAEQGLVLTGGGAKLKDLDRLLMEECGVPVIIAEDPLTCVARGGGKYLEMIDEFGLDILTID